MTSVNLVIRPEKLGDLVVATPVLRALKESYPGEELHLLTDETYAEVVRGNPYVDQIVPIRWKGRASAQHEPWLDVYRKLRGRHYARAALLYYNVEHWNWMMFALRVKQVAQLGGSYSAIGLGHRMILRRQYEGRRHFSELYLDVARALGATVTDPQPRLYVSAEETVAFRARFPFLNQPGPKIIVHPFGRGSSPNFSLAAYETIVRELAARISCRIIITGSPDEAKLWPWIDHSNILTCWLGTLSIRDWIVASSFMNLVIAGSTGVIHAAAAVGTSVIGLYCPFLGSHPDIWGPRGQSVTSLVASESQCQKIKVSDSTCSGNNSCDLGPLISISAVIHQTQSALSFQGVL